MTQSQLILSRYLYTIQIFNNGGGVGGAQWGFFILVQEWFLLWAKNKTSCVAQSVRSNEQHFPFKLILPDHHHHTWTVVIFVWHAYQKVNSWVGLVLVIDQTEERRVVMKYNKIITIRSRQCWFTMLVFNVGFQCWFSVHKNKLLLLLLLKITRWYKIEPG